MDYPIRSGRWYVHLLHETLRAKKTIKVVGEAKRSKRERRRAARLGANDDDEGAGSGSSNGEEDWGALARARRDEKLEAFVRGVKNTEGPESRQ